jgi:hypothetical protein
MSYSDLFETGLKMRKKKVNVSKKDYTTPKPENKQNEPKNIKNLIQNVTNTTPIKKRDDYKDWEENWLISENGNPINPILQELDELGFIIYMNEKGDLTYSVDGGDEEVVTKDKANNFLSNKLGRRIKLYSYEEDGIKPYDIIGITGKIFNPYTHKRFIEIKRRRFLKNEFTPTVYMNYTEQPQKEPKAILSLIGNLVNNDEIKKHYFINWLAYFFQTFKRPQTAIVLKGNQGAGKDTFFDYVIAPLFGINQVTKIDDRAIESRFNADTFQNKMFIAFNETSKGDKVSNKDTKNFLKQIITNDEVMLEEKHKKRKKIKLYFACLFFTNEAKFIEIEPSDRRYNVFLTGDNLRKSNFLGYGSFDNLALTIKKELADFARYLYHYDVDVDLANRVINTPEKEAVIYATTSRNILFYEALKNKDLEFFRSLEELEEDEMLPNEKRFIFREIEKSFAAGRIKKSLLKKIYEALFETKITSHTLYKELNAIDPYFIHANNEVVIQGQRYIKLGQ